MNRYARIALRTMTMLGSVMVVLCAGGIAATPLRAQQPDPHCAPGAAQPPVIICLGVGIIPYPAGWNLVSGPTGTIISGADAPLYTFQAGDIRYETVAAGTPLQAGRGYWVHFSQPTSIISFTLHSIQPLTLMLPAGQHVMIGNPFPSDATVSGADTVYTYTPAGGYRQTTTVPFGQGAWAFSATGGTVTIGPLN